MSQLAQRLIMAAGGVKKTSTYVEDVFSTYLYKGNQTSRSIVNGIKLGNANAGYGVDFDGTANQLNIPDSDDWDLGNGDFTLETWIKSTQTTSGYFTALGPWTTYTSPDYGWCIRYASQDIGTGWSFFYSTTGSNYITTMGSDISDGQWHHVAVCRSGNNLRTFTDGVLNTTRTTTDTFYNSGTTMKIGGQSTSGNYFDGQLSNVRLVKGTALYTANFTPPTKELTSIENTKLLCCNQSTVTGATVTPGTITVSGGSNGYPTTSAGPFTGAGAKGGMVWTKARTSSSYSENAIEDTLRGVGREVWSDSNVVESYHVERINSFNSNGYSMGTSQRYNQTGVDYVSWTFAKQEGFFDVVTWTGDNDADRQIPHNLGCIPGCIMIKSRNLDQSWSVYHRGLNQGINPEQYHMILNNANDQDTTSDWNDTAPTSTHFTVSNGQRVNYVGHTYVAYLFAGGESNADTARSVDFDGSGDYLTQTCDAVLRNWWDQAFTVEYWVNADGFVSSGNGGPGVLGVTAPTSNGETWSFGPKSNGTVEFYYWNGSIQQVTTTKTLNLGQWYHLAMVYDGSSSIKIYINGTLEKSATVQGTPTGSSTVFSIGKIASGSEFNGRVSNVRITHQALYASSFRPSTEPFTTTSQGATGSNVKLLCCNNSSTTGSTVTPGTITANGDPTASTDSPFDDPEGFKFGEEGDQNIIKCGYYKTDSNEDANVYLGWEPQWVLAKRIDANAGGDWMMYDSMRGLANAQDVLNESGVSSALLVPNSTSAETNARRIGLSSVGFAQDAYGANREYLYIAIRRPDGLVGKPVEAGTEVFNMIYGIGTNPTFAPGFPVDFTFLRRPDTTENWTTSARLIQGQYLFTNTTANTASDSNITFDYNKGFHDAGGLSSYLSWSLKRNAGFDVVTYKGNQTMGHHIPHSLGQPPEMIWTKNRDQIQQWSAGHKGLNGGTNPWNWVLVLSDYEAEQEATNFWEAPTATHFTVGSDARVNKNNHSYLAILFSSVEGISKVGSFTWGSSNQTVTTGFATRFLLMKNISNGTSSAPWIVFDSLRGFTTGSIPVLNLNTDQGQTSYTPFSDVNSTGFVMTAGQGTRFGNNGDTMIYYAHA